MIKNYTNEEYASIYKSDSDYLTALEFDLEEDAFNLIRNQVVEFERQIGLNANKISELMEGGLI